MPINSERASNKVISIAPTETQSPCLGCRLPKKMLIEFNSLNLNESGTNHDDFFHFIEKYTIKEITDSGLIEPDYEKLIKNKMATNLFLY